MFINGSLYIPGDIDEIWFWFSESSVIWSPSTPSGMFLILFSFKSIEFKRARVANDTGNSWIWFLLASISFRFLSLPEKRWKLKHQKSVPIKSSHCPFVRRSNNQNWFHVEIWVAEKSWNQFAVHLSKKQF